MCNRHVLRVWECLADTSQFRPTSRKDSCQLAKQHQDTSEGFLDSERICINKLYVLRMKKNLFADIADLKCVPAKIRIGKIRKVSHFPSMWPAFAFDRSCFYLISGLGLAKDLKMKFTKAINGSHRNIKGLLSSEPSDSDPDLLLLHIPIR